MTGMDVVALPGRHRWHPGSDQCRIRLAISKTHIHRPGYVPRHMTAAHCELHAAYDDRCRACDYADLEQRGYRLCGHTDAEGCTGHGDF